MLWLLLACTSPSSKESLVDSAGDSREDSGVDSPPLPAPVVIIGAGPAGLAAAMDLPDAVLIEAEAQVGGRFLWAGGLMAMVGTEEQAAAGVQDSVATALTEWPLITGGEATEATEAFLRASDEVHDRLVGIGVQFTLVPPADFVGTLRLHRPTGDGPAVIAAMEAALPAGLDLRLNTRATGILVENSIVTGVFLEDGSTLPASAVIIASGGFVNRADIVETLIDYPDGSWSGSPEGGASGFAMDLANANGLRTESLASIGWYSQSIGMAGFDGLPMKLSTRGGIPWITVDQTGQRFLNESRTGSVHSHGESSLHDNVWWLTTLELLQVALVPENVALLPTADPELLRCGTDWTSLATTVGIDPVTLDGTLQAEGRYRSGQELDPLGRPGPSFPDLSGTPCVLRPGHQAAKNYGGLVVDKNGAVPEFSGLYAIGEAAGMAVPGMGGSWGFDGSSAAVIWSGWRTTAALPGL
jgi:succinate dehydrogenase/fumarate reductase flavoprotein subunit